MAKKEEEVEEDRGIRIRGHSGQSDKELTLAIKTDENDTFVTLGSTAIRLDRAGTSRLIKELSRVMLALNG